MAIHPRQARLGQLLVESGLIDQTQLHSAMASAEQWGRRIPDVVVELRMVQESRVVGALSQALRIPVVDLSRVQPIASVLAKVDVALCEQRGFVPVEETDGPRTLVLAMADPTDLETIDLVTQRTRTRVRAVLAPESMVTKAIRRWYRHEDVSLLPAQEPAPVSELDELKLIDVNGQTLMVDGAVVSLKEQLERELAARRAAQPPAPVRSSPPPVRPPPPAQPAPTVAQLQQQLAALQQAHDQTQAWVRVALDLLVERGLATPDEIRARIAKRSRTS